MVDNPSHPVHRSHLKPNYIVLSSHTKSPVHSPLLPESPSSLLSPQDASSSFAYAIQVLKSQKLRTSVTQFQGQLDHAIELLATQVTWTPGVDFDNPLSSTTLTEDAKAWLSITGIEKKGGRTTTSPTFLFPSTLSDSAFTNLSTFIPSQAAVDPTVAVASLCKDVFYFSLLQTQRILEILETTCFRWDFDVFQFYECTQGHPLLFLGYYLIKHVRVLSTLPIEEMSLLKYLDEIEHTYQPQQPYHNSMHAADVLQAMCTFLMDPRFHQVIDALDWLAVIIACALHDVDHPGVNNNFLQSTKHPLAILYSDHSILEFHHLATGLTIAEHYHLFHRLSPSQATQVRQCIIDLVLATDMAKHFEHGTKFKSFLTTLEKQTEAHEWRDHSKQLVLNMAIKCSDINNPTRSLHLSKQWAQRIMEEFYLQGDRERALNAPISKFMDREKHEDNSLKCQLSFIDVIVQPLYQVWTPFLQSTLSTTLMENLSTTKQAFSLVSSPMELHIPSHSSLSSSIRSAHSTPTSTASSSSATTPSFFFPTFPLFDASDPNTSGMTAPQGGVSGHLHSVSHRRGSMAMVRLKELPLEVAGSTVQPIFEEEEEENEDKEEVVVVAEEEKTTK
ncbi:High affinity cAMP-specific 3',5'-cyclic phosphodiesterase 7A [Coelomomyces lativittatus]|nr:High affinity cAMP-specific 3',5'-cyclic phosphodiesterase 7A [Coelomomyces lativittatus]